MRGYTIDVNTPIEVLLDEFKAWGAAAENAVGGNMALLLSMASGQRVPVTEEEKRGHEAWLMTLYILSHLSERGHPI
jgi:hypothetical protein